MKKLNFFLCVGLAAGASAFALQQSPLPVPDSGLQEATETPRSPMKVPASNVSEYVLPISDSDYLGLSLYSYEDESSEFFTVNEIFSDKESIEIPDSLQGYAIISIGDPYRYYSYNTILENAQSLKSLILPKTITSIAAYLNEDHGYSLQEIHIQSEELPELSNYYYLKSGITCYFSTANAYEQALTNASWYDNMRIERENWDYEWVTVNVSKVGTFAQDYLSVFESTWDTGRYVKVTGQLNTADLQNMRNITMLMKLDLSDTQFEELPGQFMESKEFLNEVKLPGSARAIGEEAFRGCTNLESINLGNVETIGSYAFHYCYKLKEADFSNLLNVGSQAFYCSGLNNADLSNILSIGSSAFYGTGLKKISLDNALEIGSQAFASSAIESVKIPATLKSIESFTFEDCSLLENVDYGFAEYVPSYCFYGCEALSSMKLPEGLKQIGQSAFCGCSSLKNVILPSTLLEVESNAFRECKSIESFVCSAVVPPIAEYGFTDNVDMTKAILYVPSYVLDAYRGTENWNDFYIMEPLETPITNMSVTAPLTIDTNENTTPLADSLNIVLSSVYGYDIDEPVRVGQLSMIGDGPISAKKFMVFSRSGSRSNGSHTNKTYTGSIQTFVNEVTDMRADEVEVYMSLSGWANSWHFLSLPYEVKVADITATEGTNAAIRCYDSAARAEGAGGSYWYDLGADDVIKAGQGFIIMGDLTDENGRQYVPQFKFPSGNSLTKNNFFRCDDVTVPLEEHVAEFAHNRSWNLIGNPYPAYFDMRHLNEEFTSPVLVWDAYYKVYRAFSPVDDDLILRPYESFFVQRPIDRESITFKKEGRLHFDERTAGTYNAPSKTESVDIDGRNVFNFNISKNGYTDKARIVLNPEAAMEYEVGRDMSKFFGENAKGAQIFVNADTQYSISERPLADGIATLGLIASGSDTETDLYSINLNGRYAAEWSVLLTDNMTGKTVDLTIEEYAFSATESNDSRFSVRFDNTVSGVDDIIADFNAGENVTVVTLDGIKVFEGNINDWSKTPGIFVVRGEKAVRKVILK